MMVNVDAKERSRKNSGLHHASRWTREGYRSFDYCRSIRMLIAAGFDILNYHTIMLWTFLRLAQKSAAGEG